MSHIMTPKGWRPILQEETLDEADNIKSMSTEKLQKMWDASKDEQVSPVFGAQLKKVAQELQLRKKKGVKEAKEDDEEDDKKKPFSSKTDLAKKLEKNKKTDDDDDDDEEDDEKDVKLSKENFINLIYSLDEATQKELIDGIEEYLDELSKKV